MSGGASVTECAPSQFPSIFPVAASSIQVRSFAMDRPQAIQLVAVAMAPLDGDARRGKAVQLRDLGQQARLALESLPPTDSPCLGVVLVQLRAMQSLCTSWIEWWDEIQDIPSEFAQPEPELHPLLGARPVRPGSVPPYVSVVRTLCDEIKLLSTTLTPDERQHLRSALVMAHVEVAPLADALQWDALRCLGWELNELAPQLE